MKTGLFHTSVEMPLGDVGHVRPAAFLVREQPFRLRLLFSEPILLLPADVFPQNDYQFIRQVDPADTLRFGWNHLPVNSIDAALNHEILSVEVDIARLQSREFALSETGVDGREEHRVMMRSVFPGGF